MQLSAPRLLPLLHCLIALTAFQQSGLAQGTSQKPTIVFEAPGLPSHPVITRSDKYGWIIKSIRWNHFVSNNANAMDDYWDASVDMVHSMQDVKYMPVFYRLEKDPDERTFYRSKGIRIEFVGEIKKANSVYGNVDYIRAKTPSDKTCFFFQKKYKPQQWKGPKEIIRGWYCSAVGPPLSDDIIHSAIASLRVEGWKASQ